MKNTYDSRSSASDPTEVVEIEILREILGDRRGHNRGVGRKMKGQSSKRRTQPTTTNQPDLHQTVAQLQRQVQILSQKLSHEERAEMDLEMNNEAPTHPRPSAPSVHPRPLQPTPLSFQQLLQPHLHSSASLTPEQLSQFQQFQMFQSFFQMMSQSSNNSQAMMHMMTQSPQTSQASQSRTPSMPHNFQIVSIPQGQQISPMMPTSHGQQTSPIMPSSQVEPYYPQMPNVSQRQIPRNTPNSDGDDDDDDDGDDALF